MMHDIGKLILAVNMREAYQEVLYSVKDSGFTTVENRRGNDWDNSCGMGAYLLALWGFPTPLSKP